MIKTRVATGTEILKFRERGQNEVSGTEKQLNKMVN